MINTRSFIFVVLVLVTLTWQAQRWADRTDSRNSYVKAYDHLRPPAQALDWELEHQPNPLLVEQLDQDLRLQEESSQAAASHEALEQPQLLIREQQLASIEKRLGHDQHWHTLRFMILARQTINALDAMTEGTPLTPQQLLVMHQTLATAWTDADTFVLALPRLRSANDSRPVWSQINLAARNWIATLERLQQHWAFGADAAELNQDLAAARAGYDELLSRYNVAVEHQY